MKLSLSPIFALLLSMAALSSITAQEPVVRDTPHAQALERAFLGFYTSVDSAREATDPGEVVKAGRGFWHLPDEKAGKSLDDFASWLLVAKPAGVAVENVKTAGDLARMTVQFSRVKESYPSRAEVTLVRLGDTRAGNWKIVKFDPAESAPVTAPAVSSSPIPVPAGEGARETLESYLKRLSELAANPAANANPKELADGIAEWWVDKRDRSQIRAMTQGAMFFRLYQPEEWTIDSVGSASATAATFAVRVQPGNEVARRLGPNTLTFGLVNSDDRGWKISSFINPRLVPAK